MDSFEDRVKRTKLTKSNRLIAEYCLSNPSSVAFQSAADLASCIGVSDVTIIRFARALGYEGFIDLKHAWQDELCQHVDAGADSVNPVAKFLTRKHYHRDTANFSVTYAEDIYCQMLRSTLSNLTQDLLYRSVDCLCGSKRKYIVGIRTRSTAANSMATLLRMVMSGVSLITTEDYASYMQLLDLTPDDCVVFITFGRFSNFESALLNQVKSVGAQLIVITDKKASRAAQAADLLLFCEGDINLPFYSSVATVALSECIASAAAERDWEGSRDRIEQSERYLNKNEPRQR